MLAVIGGLATFIGVNLVLAFVHGAACALSQTLHVLLRFSPLAWPIKFVAWFGAAWAGLSVFEAMGGM
jgi:hypothetical protein